MLGHKCFVPFSQGSFTPSETKGNVKGRVILLIHMFLSFREAKSKLVALTTGLLTVLISWIYLSHWAPSLERHLDQAVTSSNNNCFYLLIYWPRFTSIVKSPAFNGPSFDAVHIRFTACGIAQKDSLSHSLRVNRPQSQTSKAPFTRLSSNTHDDYCTFINTQLP